MDITFLRFYKFLYNTTDEEKIIFAKSHKFTVHQIKQCFGFGNSKNTRLWEEYNRTHMIPDPLPLGPHPKFTPNNLMNINQIISKDVHSSLDAISISKSSIETGLRKLRYYYKPPKHREQGVQLR